MRKFLLKLFLLNSCLILCCSCLEVSAAEPGTKDTTISFCRVLPTGCQTALYKAQIRVFHKYFGGLLHIRRISDQALRVNFVTEVGLKLIDIEIYPDHDSVYYCMELLDRKSLLNTIVNDIRMMEWPCPEEAISCSVSRHGNREKITIRSRTGKYKSVSVNAVLKKLKKSKNLYTRMKVIGQPDSINSIKSIKFVHGINPIRLRLDLIEKK
jgi:hypothetical protein